MRQFELELQAAENAVRILANARGGNLSEREAHDAWRWSLVSAGWTCGQGGAEFRQHSRLKFFGLLSESERGHALAIVKPASVEAVEAVGPVEAVEAETGKAAQSGKGAGQSRRPVSRKAGK